MVQGLSFVEEDVQNCCAALKLDLSNMARRGYEPLWRRQSPEEKMAWQKLQQDSVSCS